MALGSRAGDPPEPETFPGFAACLSLPGFRDRLASGLLELERLGNYFLVSQNGAGGLTLDDSHEYGDEPDHLDKPKLDQFILRHAQTIPDGSSFETAKYRTSVDARPLSLDTLLVKPHPTRVHVDLV